MHADTMGRTVKAGLLSSADVLKTFRFSRSTAFSMLKPNSASASSSMLSSAPI